VFALDIDTARLEDAHRAGADHVFLSQAGVHRKVIDATGGIGVDAAITAAAAPSNDPLLLAAQLARDRGVIVLVGDVPVDLPREPLYRKELLLRVSRSYGPGRYDREYEERGLDYPIGYVRWTERRNMESILALQARGLLELGDLIDEVFPVEAAPAAYERLAAPAEDRPRGALLLSYPAEPEAVIAAAPVAEARPRRPRQAHEPVRIGLIGPGRFARTVMIPAFAAAGAKLELVGGGAGPSAEAARRDFGFDRVAARERAVIEDDRVDAVVICTRHASHASLVVRALDAGKHVFCEKPLALSLQELEGVLAAASRSDGILAVGFNRRYSPLVARLRQVFEGRASPLVVTYRIAAGRVAADHWQHDPAEGGGRVLGEVGHFVDTVTYVTGSPVVQVHALAQSDAEKPIQARDDVSATLLLEDGSVATIAYIADVGPGVPKERVEVHGSSRSAVLEDFRELDVYEAGRRDRQRSRVQRKGHAEEIEAFLDGVRRGDYPVPLESIENVTLATIAIVESIRTARPVELGPVPRLQEHRAPPSRH
jgi:predicted dehydrogenase